VKTNNEKTDYYRMQIGVRTLQWTSNELLLNNESIYLRGFGKHEDSIVSYLNVINTNMVTPTNQFKIFQTVDYKSFNLHNAITIDKSLYNLQIKTL